MTPLLWGLGTGGVTYAASQTVSSGESYWSAIVALITAVGGIAAAFVASRYRNGNGEVRLTRAEYDLLLRNSERRKGDR